jgi:hypothetical protein
VSYPERVVLGGGLGRLDKSPLLSSTRQVLANTVSPDPERNIFTFHGNTQYLGWPHLLGISGIKVTETPERDQYWIQYQVMEM